MKTRNHECVKLRSAADLPEVAKRLRSVYGQPRHYNPEDPLEDLIFIVLSRMTQEFKYVRTYRELRNEFPTWDAVKDAPESDLERLIRDAGLAPTMSRQIKRILTEIENREGKLDLGRLRDVPDDEVESYLTSLPGVARKTARCVMLYALGRDTCPVDAHVWRVLKRLGVGAAGRWNEAACRRLEEAIPLSLRRTLHVTLVSHGRAICRARSPLCHECVLRDLCPSVTAS